jgi:lipopolysaccharide transport system permease protein
VDSTVQHDLGIERVLRPRRGLWGVNLRELWQYRELFLFLAWRDILVRYKQTYIGVAWAVLQPVLTVLVFTVLFGYIANFKDDRFPYGVVAAAALRRAQRKPKKRRLKVPK